ncbi:hypothetical protein [Nakamurella sp.]|uniref:hypothetical protein n=1 Tax=Nakamurella sp. TaxID=1869182 RepID=UPI003B3A2A88
MTDIVKCTRCGRRYRGHGEWNVVVSAGRPTGYLCPGCQTTEENVEAVINEAGLHYMGADNQGRLIARQKR